MHTPFPSILVFPALAGLLLLGACDNKSTGLSSSAAPVVEIVTSSGVSMVHLPGGEFTMGSDKESSDEAPAHTVMISPFLMDQYEVNGGMFVKAEFPNPSHWQSDPKMPIEQIRWRDARLYCNERSLMEGLRPCYDEDKPGWPCDFEANGYRLPTEAEWEYAAWAGGAGRHRSTDAGKLKQHAWFDSNSGKRTHPGGTRKPNAWGLHDMLGNVSEWCQDIYAADYYATSPPTDPSGPKDLGKGAAKRVMRGGNWKSSAAMCRVTFRQGQITGDTDACFTTDYCGFRCVRRVTDEELEELKKDTFPITMRPFFKERHLPSAGGNVPKAGDFSAASFELPGNHSPDFPFASGSRRQPLLVAAAFSRGFSLPWRIVRERPFPRCRRKCAKPTSN